MTGDSVVPDSQVAQDALTIGAQCPTPIVDCFIEIFNNILFYKY